MRKLARSLAQPRLVVQRRRLASVRALAAAVHQALTAVPVHRRRAVERAYFGGLTQRQIAGALA